MSAPAAPSLPFVAALFVAGDRVGDARDELCALDAAAGDGDMGATLATGFTAIRESEGVNGAADIGAALSQAGTELARKTPGTIGALLATAFMRGGKTLDGVVDPEPAQIAEMLAVATAAVAERGGVTVGQRTVVDAMAGSAEAAAAAAHRGASLVETLDEAAGAHALQPRRRRTWSRWSVEQAGSRIVPVASPTRGRPRGRLSRGPRRRLPRGVGGIAVESRCDRPGRANKGNGRLACIARLHPDGAYARITPHRGSDPGRSREELSCRFGPSPGTRGGDLRSLPRLRRAGRQNRQARGAAVDWVSQTGPVRDVERRAPWLDDRHDDGLLPVANRERGGGPQLLGEGAELASRHFLQAGLNRTGQFDEPDAERVSAAARPRDQTFLDERGEQPVDPGTMRVELIREFADG